MNMSLRALLAACGATLSLSAAGQQVEVQFPAEHRYADAGDTALQVEQTERRLVQALHRLAARHLAAGEQLTIEFRDIDLAGEPQRGVAPNSPRLLRGRTDPPRLEFAFRVETPQGIARSGEARLSDLAYLQGFRALVADGPLPFEEQLLDRWFRAQFQR